MSDPKTYTEEQFREAMQYGFRTGWKQACAKIVAKFQEQLKGEHEAGRPLDTFMVPVADLALAVAWIGEHPPEAKVEPAPTPRKEG